MARRVAHGESLGKEVCSKTTKLRGSECSYAGLGLEGHMGSQMQVAKEDGAVSVCWWRCRLWSDPRSCIMEKNRGNDFSFEPTQEGVKAALGHGGMDNLRGNGV
jgi:hypothetical protein